MTDRELLREYVSMHCQRAFSAIVERPSCLRAKKAKGRMPFAVRRGGK